MPTVEIPGGTAELFTPAEITPRRRKPIELLSSMIGRVVGSLQKATRIYCDGNLIEDHTDDKDKDGKPLFLGGDVHVTRAQLALLSELNDASAWALLKSWTLDAPLPATPDEFLDIAPGVYDALRVEAGKLIAADMGDVFGPDALGDDPDEADTSLPTSASAA